MAFLDEIQKKFNERLNKNTKGIVFKMGQFIQQSGTQFIFKERFSNVLAYNTPFVPCMITGIDTPKNIPNKDLYEWVFTLTCALEGESESKDPQLSQRTALDEFRKDLVDNPIFSLDVNGTNYNVNTTAYHISLISNTGVLNDKKRTFVSMQIGAQSGIDAYFGGDSTFEFKLNPGDDYTKITPLSANLPSFKTPNTNQLLNDKTTKTTALDKTISLSMTVYYDDNPIVNAWVEELLKNDVTMNTPYYFQFTYNTKIPSVQKVLILDSGTPSTELGIVQQIQLNFKEFKQ